MDYSENYKNKHQNDKGYFTIYTACIYTFCKKVEETFCTSFALIALENDHGCNVSFALNNFLIKEIEKRIEVKKIKFWSDGYVSQFRNQYAFYMMTKFSKDIDIQWHFFEANHGKGAVDGAGEW